MAEPKTHWWGFDKAWVTQPPLPGDNRRRYIGEMIAAAPKDVLDQKQMEAMIRVAYNYTPSPHYTHTVGPRATKVRAALDRASIMLPMRLAHRISNIRFGPEGVTDPVFEVCFVGGKVIQFDNLDTFPTEEDIARIAVECP